jgi:hypothetical protein
MMIDTLTKEEVSQWIDEEWKELITAGSTFNEAKSIIIDANYKWMRMNPENETFVYNKLNELGRNNIYVP